MSRHRNIRSMNYNDEYDGYDDVYGHSVEEDYPMSPSDAAFMYTRDGAAARSQPKIAAFIRTETDITEEEDEANAVLAVAQVSDETTPNPELDNCVKLMESTLGSDFTKERMRQVAEAHNMNAERAINFLLDTQPKAAPKKDLPTPTKPKFVVPQFSVTASVPSSTALLRPNPAAKLTNSNVETPQFKTLSEYTRNHFANVANMQPSVPVGNATDKSKFILPRFDGSPNNRIIDAGNTAPHNPPALNQINAQLSSVKIAPPKVVAWNVDLRNALKPLATSNTSVAASRLKSVRSANRVAAPLPFKPEFIDCDQDVDVTAASRADHVCVLDRVGVLRQSMAHIAKRRTSFGRVVCGRYRKRMPGGVLRLVRRPVARENAAVVRFAFATVSPDDAIIARLRRK